MFSRKFSSNIRRKKRMIISSIILLVVCLSTGYAVFTTNLGINGTLEVSKYDHTLYGVLEKAVSQGYAREYTGEHQDSMTGVGTEKIYHWYAPTGTAGNSLANEILDKNNVIFADHCWQIIRTTDTGGVKMIYNGEPENGQCLNTRGNHVGYGSRTTQSMSTNYYYGTSYNYDKTNNVFSLDGTVTTGTIQTGQYTCKQTTSTGTCATLYLVDTLSSGTSYYVLTLNNSATYSSIGKTPYNPMSTSAAYVGYMYNTVYSYNTKSVPSTMMYTQTPMNNGLSYYYGTDVTYNSSTDQYTLTDAVQNTWSNQYSSARGLYTCRSTTSSTCSTVYYIVLGVSSNMFGIVMSGGHLLDYYNTNIILGRGYTESNGQYTLTNTASIKKLDWYNNYATYNHYYICNNFDTTCNSITYITSPYSYYYFGLTSNYNNYIYGSNFTYNETTNKYTLGSDRIQFWEMNNTDKQNLNTHHYTCFNDTGECSTLSYINYAETPSNAAYIYYINLTDGKSINDALNEMLLNDNVNQVNSIIKKGIDEWYKKYMISYTSKLEDTIFCNDRSIYDLGEWNPNGGGVTPSLLFKNYNSNTGLNCGNMTDKFSTLNSKAQLLYPVGLLTSPEIRLLNNPNISKNATMYWLNSPYAVGYNFVIEQFVDNYGEVSTEYVENKYGVRPVISLKPGTEYASGTGSMADPYIVDVPMATLTITYTNGNGGATLHEPYVETMPVGKSYSITSPTIPGYTTTMPVVTGTMTNEGRIASVIYLEDSSNPPIIG